MCVIFDLIMLIVRIVMGDVLYDVICSVVDVVLEYLKDDDMKDFDKKKEIDDVFDVNFIFK